MAAISDPDFDVVIARKILEKVPLEEIEQEHGISSTALQHEILEKEDAIRVRRSSRSRETRYLLRQIKPRGEGLLRQLQDDRPNPSHSANPEVTMAEIDTTLTKLMLEEVVKTDDIDNNVFRRSGFDDDDIEYHYKELKNRGWITYHETNECHPPDSFIMVKIVYPGKTALKRLQEGTFEQAYPSKAPEPKSNPTPRRSHNGTFMISDANQSARAPETSQGDANMSTDAAPPVVFISYSHDDNAHKQWVLELATKLRRDGVHVLLDVWELGPGLDLPRFMEKALTAARRVVVICSERYVHKAENAEGGVGYEKTILTAQLMKSIASDRIIPVIRNNNNTSILPTFLDGRFYIDMRADADVDEAYDQLARAIHRQPRDKAPPIGSNPYT